MAESAPGRADSSTDGSGKEVSCGVCERGFSHNRYLLDHMRQNHPNELVECPACNNLFKNEAGMKKHHGRMHDESLAGVQVNCDNCGGAFRKSKHDVENTEFDFCSQKCFGKHESETMRGENNPKHKPKITVDCAYCGDEKEMIPSKEGRHSRYYCDNDCKSKWQSENNIGENSHVWKGGYTRYYGPNWDEQREKALERDGGKCQYCLRKRQETDTEFHVHHIRRLMWFKENYDAPEWWEKGNDIDNLVTLCEPCHGKWEGVQLRPDTR